MLNNGQNAEECDATKADSTTKAGQIKFAPPFPNLL